MIHKEDINLTFPDQPDIIPMDDKSHYLLRGDYSYIWRYNKSTFKITVVNGFYYDGTSVPRLLWSLIDIYPDGIHRPASLIHDYIYKHKGILKNNIHDSIDNTTRFIVIGNHNIAASGSDKTSILISIDNKAGSLNELLSPLSKNKISMSKIESIPTRINNWEYMFLLDIDGHVDDKVVGQVLKEIQKKTSFYKNLGSYPKSI